MSPSLRALGNMKRNAQRKPPSVATENTASIAVLASYDSTPKLGTLLGHYAATRPNAVVTTSDLIAHRTDDRTCSRAVSA